MKKTKIVLAITLFLLVLAYASPFAHAAECTVDGKAVPTAVDFNCTNTAAGGGVTSILLWIISFLAVGVGVAVVAGIVFGGITYSMSNGDPAKAKQGREIIINSIIGLLLFIFLFSAVNFFVPGGLFN